ncbi:MAG: hypothetical protein KBT11_00135 [Treponema sp.]|nr:hypothetical protein [Candidatus Treponema equifaecale]
MKKNEYLNKEMNLAELNESYFPRFYIIHPEKCEKMKVATVSSQQLRIELDANAAKVPVNVKVTNDYNSIVSTACEELLKNLGLQISSKSADYELKIDVTPSARTVENPRMYYCEYTLSAKMTGKSDGVIVPWDAAGRSGDKTEELAKKKAYTSISEKIKSEYKDTFEEYFYQLN